ncbi:MAG: hypothetical protein DMG96_28580, partial [Acidobacteria bacterium]
VLRGLGASNGARPLDPWVLLQDRRQPYLGITSELLVKRILSKIRTIRRYCIFVPYSIFVSAHRYEPKTEKSLFGKQE